MTDLGWLEIVILLAVAYAVIVWAVGLAVGWSPMRSASECHCEHPPHAPNHCEALDGGWAPSGYCWCPETMPWTMRVGETNFFDGMTYHRRKRP